MRFSEAELEEWARVQTEKEEDTQALLKYSKEDEATIRKLTSQLEHAEQEYNRTRQLLDRETSDLDITRIELAKTSNEFAMLHLERQALISRWEQTLDLTAKKNEDITQFRQAYEKLKEDGQALQAIIDEKQSKLDQQVDANAQLEKNLEMMDIEVGRLRLAQREASQRLTDFGDEVQVTRGTLARGKSALFCSDQGNLKLAHPDFKDTNTGNFFLSRRIF